MHNSKPARSNKEAKTGQIIKIEQNQLTRHLDKVVRGTVEQTLNALLDAEADRLCQIRRRYGAPPPGASIRACLGMGLEAHIAEPVNVKI